MPKISKQSIHENFDKKFEGYWRGHAIPDEIKFSYDTQITNLLGEILPKEYSEEINLPQDMKWGTQRVVDMRVGMNEVIQKIKQKIKEAGY